MLVCHPVPSRGPSLPSETELNFFPQFQSSSQRRSKTITNCGKAEELYTADQMLILIFYKYFRSMLIVEVSIGAPLPI